MKLIAFLFISLPAFLFAQPAIEWMPGGDIGAFGPFPLNQGWRFRVSSASDVEVFALGAYDNQGNGLDTNHEVAIWPVSGGVPLVVATVPSGVSAYLDGHFRYVNITPLHLFKDTEYIIGSHNWASRELSTRNVAGFTNAPQIVYITNQTATPAALTFPTSSSSGFTNGYFGPNFRFNAVPSLPKMTVRLSEVELCWTSVSNVNYYVQYKSALTTNEWVNLAGPISGSGTNNCLEADILPNEPKRYYRVIAPP